MSGRDDIRAAFFGIKTRSLTVNVAGVDIEVRQPSVKDVMSGATKQGTDNSNIIVKVLIDQCFIPGTDEKVFEETDMDALMATPFGKDWQLLNDAINKLSDLSTVMAEQKGNSDATPAA